MASSDQPNYRQSSYAQPRSSSNVFYESEVKKDSEIMLRDSEVQHLLQQSRDIQHSQQQQMQQHQQQLLQQPIKSEPQQLQQHHQQQQQLLQQPIKPEPQQLQQHHEQQHQQQQQLLQLPVKSEPISPEKMAPVSSSTSEISQNLTGSTCSSTSEDRNRLSQSDRAHMCMTCFKGFRNKPQLTQHELVHNNVRKHVCSYCEKSFKQICHLNQHIRVHTGERPYKCDVEECGRSFAQLSNLNHHKKNHDDPVKRDVSRQFKCEVCERSYATQNSLNTHFQKLHSNLTLGNTSPMEQSVPTVPRKRKKKQSNSISNQVTDEACTFLMECDSDDGLPTQVKLKSRLETKPNLTVRIGTPPANGDRDKNRQMLRTTLPLPFTTVESRSSPLSLRYQQSQGQDDLITTFSNSVSQGQSHRDLMQAQQHPQNLYSQIDSLSEQNRTNRSMHDNSQLLHASSTNTEQNDGQNDEMNLMNELSKSEAIIAERRKQMEAAISHREALLNSNRAKSHFGQIDIHSSLSASGMPQIHGVSSEPVSPADRRPLYGHQQGQVTQASVQSDVPSHIAHHYPKTENADQSRVDSHQIFNPAFTEQNQNISQSRFSQNQY